MVKNKDLKTPPTNVEHFVMTLCSRTEKSSFKFAVDWKELQAKTFYSDNCWQNIWNKVKKSRKIGQEQKTMISKFA